MHALVSRLHIVFCFSFFVSETREMWGKRERGQDGKRGAETEVWDTFCRYNVSAKTFSLWELPQHEAWHHLWLFLWKHSVYSVPFVPVCTHLKFCSQSGNICNPFMYIVGYLRAWFETDAVSESEGNVRVIQIHRKLCYRFLTRLHCFCNQSLFTYGKTVPQLHNYCTAGLIFFICLL